MRWRDREGSSNIEDRRGLSPKGIIGCGIGKLIFYILLHKTLKKTKI